MLNTRVLIVIFCYFLLSIDIFANNNESETVSYKKNLIYEAFNSKRTYELKLYSDITLHEKKRNLIKFIPVRAIFKMDKDKEKISFSLQDSYAKNSMVKLTLELHSIIDDTVLECDASFLKSLNLGYFYDMNINISDNKMICAVYKKEKFPKLINDNFEIKPEDLIKLKEKFNQES